MNYLLVRTGIYLHIVIFNSVSQSISSFILLKSSTLSKNATIDSCSQHLYKPSFSFNHLKTNEKCTCYLVLSISPHLTGVLTTWRNVLTAIRPNNAVTIYHKLNLASHCNISLPIVLGRERDRSLIVISAPE